ncbi:MAG: rhodanese-like domain-containing protein [Deltaproteobacteria bacterium]|jgi:rhodanese-related sulfurtransferase|nr:rhodanese-like domain-containing protein [Deltaproteobacteria bacterium]
METIKEISILVSAAIITALAVNYFSPAGIALVGQWDTSEGVITANEKNDIALNDLEIGDVALAKKLYDSQNFVFVDARSRDDYDEGHIKGAVSLPVGQFDEKIEAFLEQYSPEKAIVTYCSGRTCEDSHKLAQLLMELGYTEINVFIDGFPGWEAEGYPIE